jgi:hypothetical protein
MIRYARIDRICSQIKSKMKVAHKAVNVPVSHKKPETPEKAKRMGKKIAKQEKQLRHLSLSLPSMLSGIYRGTVVVSVISSIRNGRKLRPTVKQ